MDLGIIYLSTDSTIIGNQVINLITMQTLVI